jgi:hypothetical protein
MQGNQDKKINKYPLSSLCALCVLISADSAVKALNPNRKGRKGKTRNTGKRLSYIKDAGRMPAFLKYKFPHLK